MTLSYLYSRVFLERTPLSFSLRSLVRRSRWFMMTLLSAFRVRFCSFNSVFSFLIADRSSFPSSNLPLNCSYSSLTLSANLLDSSVLIFAFFSLSWNASFNLLFSFYNRATSFSKTAKLRSPYASKMEFFSSRVSFNLVRFLMKRTISSFAGGISLAVVDGVEKRGSGRAILPMILPSERLRLALHRDISC